MGWGGGLGLGIKTPTVSSFLKVTREQNTTRYLRPLRLLIICGIVIVVRCCRLLCRMLRIGNNCSNFLVISCGCRALSSASIFISPCCPCRKARFSSVPSSTVSALAPSQRWVSVFTQHSYLLSRPLGPNTPTKTLLNRSGEMATTSHIVWFASVVCCWADCCGSLNPPIPTKESSYYHLCLDSDIKYLSFNEFLCRMQIFLGAFHTIKCKHHLLHNSYFTIEKI